MLLLEAMPYCNAVSKLRLRWEVVCLHATASVLAAL